MKSRIWLAVIVFVGCWEAQSSKYELIFESIEVPSYLGRYRELSKNSQVQFEDLVCPMNVPFKGSVLVLWPPCRLVCVEIGLPFVFWTESDCGQ